MAIFHFSAKVIGRSSGRSAVAAAAYRAGERLHDERIDRTHDFTNKAGVLHSEVMLPKGAPEAFADRATLWNAVEGAEKRKDAQLSREVDFALPRELSKKDNIKLAREFVKGEFVEKGMIADLNVHWDIGEDGKAKPHAHVMLTMREVTKDGFGAKVRGWNKTALIEQWRERWADHVNRALAERDIDARIDHRSLEAQGIALEPQDKIGPAASRIGGRGLEAERIEEHRAIAQRNGTRIIANPALALDAITHQQATFTRRDLAAFVHRHSDGKEQFDATYSAVRASPDLIVLGKDGRGQDRFTSRAMIETEQRLHRAADAMAQRDRHAVNDVQRNAAFSTAAKRGLSCPASRNPPSSTSPSRAVFRLSSAMPEPARAPCWAWRARPGKARATMCAAQPYPASLLKAWRTAPASRRAPSPALNTSGAKDANNSRPATCS